MKNSIILFILIAIIPLFSFQNTTNTKLSCTNCTNAINSTGTYIVNSTNCTNCTDCSNVINCFQCTNVYNSSDVSNSQNVYNSSLITDSKNIYNSYNVTKSDTCTSCRHCVECMSCSDCSGYFCQNDENCRNSRWLFYWTEPAENDTNAWKCSNKVVNDDWYFNRAGYKKPDFLEAAETNQGDFDFCLQFNGNRSCCNKETTKQISSIFSDYKATLQLRSTKKINSLKSVFEQYHSIDLDSISDPSVRTSIQQGVVEQMRLIKITIYNLAKTMSSCGKALLTYVSGMLCMGCLPDWRWEKYVLSKDPSKSLPIEEFDPELLLNFTIDLNSDPLQLSVLIGRQACEDLYSVCKPLMQSFEQFSNDSAMAIGGFADQITSNQWNFNAFSTSEKLTIRNNAQQLARNLSHRNVSWLKPQGSETGVDTKTVPTYNPSAEQQALANFKASLRNLGTEYPYDPVAYYNFDPSINFEDPVIMNSQMCQLMTQAKTCVLCSGSERNSSCDQLDAVYYEIETDTDRQYRDFSAYFFQVRAVYLVYNDGGNEFVRKLLFPPFREGEIVLKLKDSTWEFKKNYFQVLESNILSQYESFKKVRDSEDEFRIWNDEYWMNFIYSPALTQSSSFFTQLLKSLPNLDQTSYSFSCELNGTCSLCDKTQCSTKEGYQPYCEDCHFSNVKVEAKCEAGGCITCLYIGGGTLPYEDTDLEPDALDDDIPMDKCYIRAGGPFFKEGESEYSAPFYRESDATLYGQMVDLFDLNNEADIPWNIAQIGQWFYKIAGSERLSVVNVMQVLDGIMLPNTTNCTHYNYLLPCDLNNPINQCKRWLCDFLIDGFFPNPKIIYDPQSLNDTFYESIWANTSVFDYELLVQAKLNGSHSLWNLSWGSPDPNINTSYYDVAYWGPDTTTLSNLGVIIDGISEETDIISFVNADEKDIYGIRIGFSVLSLFLIWLLSN